MENTNLRNANSGTTIDVNIKINSNIIVLLLDFVHHMKTSLYMK